jgi:uncharacterized protein (DUF58 family)
MLVAFSAISRFFRRRFTLAGRVALVAAAAAAMLGVDTERSMTYQAFTLLAAFVAVGWLGTLGSKPAVRVTRALPRTATAGEPCAYTLRIENLTPRRLSGLVLQDNPADPRPSLREFVAAGPPPDARSLLARISGYRRWRWLVSLREIAATAPVALDAVPAAGTVEVTATLAPRRRGHLRLESVTLARPDLLGIAQSSIDVEQRDALVVLPRRYRLPPVDLPGVRRYQRGGVTSAGSVGDSEEFLSLREYRPGDPLQRVHWKSFARIGEPVVKEYQEEFFERHLLVLDTFGEIQAAERFEEAVSVAASYASTIDTRECLLDLMFVGEQAHCITAGRGLASATRLLEALAGARLSPGGSFEQLARAVRARRGDHAGAVVVLLAYDEARAEFLRHLRANGVALLAWVVIDAGTPAPAETPWLRVLEAGRVQQGLARAGQPA